MKPSTSEIQNAIEQAAKASYGKLLAYLSSRSRDIQACEDAVAEAFKRAAEKWPVDGIPDNLEAWLFKVAKNALIDMGRRAQSAVESESTLALLEGEKAEGLSSEPGFADERLKLLFVCCHPSIDEGVRTALMLQTVLGLEAKDIASAFLTSPAAMTKKLVRAKQKIKLAQIDFSIPEKEELAKRTEFVTEAIYALYGKSWDTFGSEDGRFRDLDEEAIYLAELLANLLPEEPEPKGLLALILHCESRKKARRSRENIYIPLDEQNKTEWDIQLISKAEFLLHQAFQQKKIGRFQIEAAIQSAHSARVAQGINNWQQILDLYNGLVALAPTVGVFVNRAGAIAEHSGAEAGIKALDEIPSELVVAYQPYWALKAALLHKIGDSEKALYSYERAIGLSEDEPVRAFLQKKRALVR